jgi:hypothetical protein
MKFVTFGFVLDCAPDTVLATRKQVLRMAHVRLCAALERDAHDRGAGECYGVSLADEANVQSVAREIKKLPGVSFAEPQ